MNKVMLIGYVGNEPQVRYLDGGLCVAQIRLATTERGYTLPNGTNVPDRTEWHNVVFWRRQAEVVEKYVHKGDKLYVEGKIQTRTYDDKKTGQRRQVIDIMADNMELFSSKAQSELHAQGQANQSYNQVSGQNASQPVQPTGTQTAPPAPEPEDKYPF